MSTQPDISVIMPVYNAEKYLDKAIASILAQTYRNFEFIIVNDCSKDKSAAIIAAYDDPRIIYKSHDINKGVVQAMNTGITSCRAPLICIMHADDIALPERLEKQKAWMDRHPDTALLAGKTITINENEEPAPSWAVDERTTSRQAIRRMMKWENCITHSTVMIRTEILKKYGYDSSQQLKEYAVEDYPLWLNILADGLHIDKLPEPVIRYRVHQQNTTNVHYRKINPYYLYYQTKKIYLQDRKNRNAVTRYDKAIRFTMWADRIKATLKDIKTGLTGLLKGK